MLSVNEKMVIEKVESSIKFVNSRYQITIPWKEVRPSLPDSFKMAFQRLQNLEKHLMRSPDVAAEYNQVIVNHLEKGFVRKVETCMEQPELTISGTCHILLWLKTLEPLLRYLSCLMLLLLSAMG